MACIDCHREVAVAELPRRPAAAARGARTIQLDFAATSCPACHGDPHRGEAERLAGPQGCRACHDVHGWGEIAFDHGRTAFPLRGAHARAACGSCHRVAAAGGETRVVLGGLPTACASCHADPHRGQFERRGRAAACASCHREESWSRLAFDHDRDSDFPLAGAHREVPCASCHRRITRGGERFVQFEGLPRTCEGCHATGSGG